MIRKILICAMALAPIAVEAQSELGRIELTPYGAYSFGGKVSNTDSNVSSRFKDSENFGLILNVRESSKTQWEFIYSRQSTSVDIIGLSTGNVVLDSDVHYLQLGGTYQGEGDKIRPYLAATVGAAYFDVLTDGFDGDTFLSFSIGTGLQIWPTKRLGLRLEARAFGTVVRSDSSLFCVSNPGAGSSGCAVSVAGDVLWQVQTIGGFVIRF